jgi:Signal peptidase, peptidase S26
VIVQQVSSISFIKRVVALPGDRISIRNSRVIRNGAREAGSYVAPCAGGSACNLPNAFTADHPAPLPPQPNLPDIRTAMGGPGGKASTCSATSSSFAPSR